MTIRYETDSDVYPFIVAPGIAKLQQRLVVAAAGLFEYPEDFINTISRYKALTTPEPMMVAQIHWYRGSAIFSITVQVASRESFSNRTGISLTIGALLTTHALRRRGVMQHVVSAAAEYFRQHFGLELNVPNVAATIERFTGDDGFWGVESLLTVFEIPPAAAKRRRLKSLATHVSARIKIRAAPRISFGSSLADMVAFAGRLDAAFAARAVPAFSHRAELLKIQIALVAAIVVQIGLAMTLTAAGLPWHIRVAMVVADLSVALAIGVVLGSASIRILTMRYVGFADALVALLALATGVTLAYVSIASFATLR